MNTQVRRELGKYRLTVGDYTALDETGAFSGLETELVGGDVIVMSPEWRPHLRIKSELFYLLRRAVDDAGLSYFVGSDGSVALSDTDMPRPDILLTADIYGDGAVPHESVPLVIEVSSSTLADDLGPKARSYARAGVPEYWVVDVNGRMIHQMWEPTGDSYAKRFRRVADAVDTAMPGYEAWSEASVAIALDMVPEPDILVTSFAASDRAPVPVETVALVVEVADTMLRYDLHTKAAIYASAGVPEYWVVDVNGRVIHQLWEPTGEGFEKRRKVAFGKPLTSRTITDLTISTDAL